MWLFPPQRWEALHQDVLDEILDERVSSSRGRRNARGVKKKMSNWSIRSRSTPCNIRLEFTDLIVVVGVPDPDKPNSIPELNTDTPSGRARELAECRAQV